jgi:hypothetical protein
VSSGELVDVMCCDVCYVVFVLCCVVCGVGWIFDAVRMFGSVRCREFRWKEGFGFNGLELCKGLNQ